TMHVALPRALYPTGDRVVAFYSGLVAALQERLGAQAVGVVDELPLTGDRGRSVVTLTPGDRGPEAVGRSASHGYFEVMRIPIRAGRSFAAQDNPSVEPRAVISELLREQLFGSRSAIGTRVWLASRRQWVEVVGVVGQVKHRALDEASLPTVYL